MNIQFIHKHSAFKMKERPAETRTYTLELVPIFWNFIALLTIIIGLMILCVGVSLLFLIPFGLFFLGITFYPEKAIILKRRRTIQLFSDYLKIVETNKKIAFEKIIWFRVDKNARSPVINFFLKEEGVLFPASFASFEKSEFFQNWVGFKTTSIRRIKRTNPDSLPYFETKRGKLVNKVLWILVALLFSTMFYKHPWLMFGILLVLVTTIIWILKE